MTELDNEMMSFIEKQNDWVKGHFTPGNEYRYDTTEGKMHLLQGIIDLKMYDKTRTSELQSLGICFGEVLSKELELDWIIVEDEYGRDPALRYKNSSILFFPRTMISKRIENDEDISIQLLFDFAKNTLQKMIEKGY